jgi:adenylate cyclase
MRFLSPSKNIKQFLELIKQHGISFALSLGIMLLMLLHASNALPLAFVHQLENYSYDLRLNLLMPRTLDSRIVIVDIDEKSLAEQGRWPWGRDKLALMMDRLFDDYQINTLGFDVVFAEKDESSGLKNLERMQQDFLKDNVGFADALKIIKPKLNYDQIFADSLKNRKIVLGYYFQTNGDNNKIGQLPAEIFSADSFENNEIGKTRTRQGTLIQSLTKMALLAKFRY